MHQLKFNADYADRPRLRGTIGVDLKRAEPWSLGLVALTLRDLVEGDITLGHGASKGYGACQAVITSVSPPSQFGNCTQWAKDWGLPGLNWDRSPISLLSSDEIKYALEAALVDLHDRLGSNQGLTYA